MCCQGMVPSPSLHFAGPAGPVVGGGETHLEGADSNGTRK